MCYFVQGLRLFKGLRLLFLQYVSWGTFIQGATFIPESRVVSFLGNPLGDVGPFNMMHIVLVER